MGYILASKTYTDNGQTFRLVVEGGLNYIKGNTKPYFSITASQFIKKGNNRFYEYACGCLHDEIKKVFGSKFDDLIALHLSDIDGMPMHPVENGAYYLGFSKYQGFNPESASNHFRISKDELMNEWFKIIKKDDVASLCNKLAPSWKMQANQCIESHSLKIYGDTWKEA
jgi:hypothetical protein